jgi:hypothetical protein
MHRGVVFHKATTDISEMGKIQRQWYYGAFVGLWMMIGVGYNIIGSCLWWVFVWSLEPSTTLALWLGWMLHYYMVQLWPWSLSHWQ